MTDAEKIHQALGDEEAVFVTAEVLGKVMDAPELCINEQLASGELTKETLALMAAITVTHDIGRMYGVGTRAIAGAAIKINELRKPDDFK